MQRPSSALVRRKAASEERQHRPRTSLGFARKSDVCCKGSQLVGFDVSEYFRRHGSSAGLHIGVNGRPSGDVALRSYVEDCRLEALVRELEEEEEKEWVTGWKKKTGGSESHIQQQAPLCWDALLEKTEVSMRVPHGEEARRVSRTKVVYATQRTGERLRHPRTRALQRSLYVESCAAEDQTSWVSGDPDGRCQREEIEDEDTTDLREIAEKYPEIGLRVVDIEGRGVDDENHWRRRERGRGTARLAVSITVPSGFTEDKGRSVRKICRSPAVYPPISSHTSSGYIGIVKKHLSPYLN